MVPAAFATQFSKQWGNWSSWSFVILIWFVASAVAVAWHMKLPSECIHSTCGQYKRVCDCSRAKVCAEKLSEAPMRSGMQGGTQASDTCLY